MAHTKARRGYLLDETSRLLWKHQAQIHPQPPSPALVDRHYELGHDEFAWRLQWCMLRGVSPYRHEGVYNWSYVAFGNEWPEWDVKHRGMDPFGLRDALIKAMLRRRWWHRSLCLAYAKLLHVPKEEFPCIS